MGIWTATCEGCGRRDFKTNMEKVRVPWAGGLGGSAKRWFHYNKCWRDYIQWCKCPVCGALGKKAQAAEEREGARLQSR